MALQPHRLEFAALLAAASLEGKGRMTRTSDSTGIAIYSIMITPLTLAWVYIPA
jgi:hypothetical protein